MGSETEMMTGRSPKFLVAFFLLLIGCSHASLVTEDSLRQFSQGLTQRTPPGATAPNTAGLNVDLSGKVAFVAGVADTSGYGWAIAKILSQAGATVVVGTWPPMYDRFQKMLSSGEFDQQRKFSKTEMRMMQIAKVYPMDASYDSPEDVPEDIRENRRYASVLKQGYGISVGEVAARVAVDFGRVDFLVHSIANGPEVGKPLLSTSRSGYLAATSASAFSMISLVQRFAPLMPEGGSVLSITYIASERVIPGYGGGMSSAKAALESDTKTLAFEAGRKYGIRVNTISAGPLKSRAASAIKKPSQRNSFIDFAIAYSKANSPLSRDLSADDVASSALFLLSPLSRAVTGSTLYVDNGMNVMGMALDSKSLEAS